MLRYRTKKMNFAMCGIYVKTWLNSLKTLGYSKSLEMHKLAVAVHFGVYNFVRQHHTLGTTPAVAAGLEEKPWDLEQVVEMSAAYCRQKEGTK
jgi:hypothetical protein